jgi:hypothetical protein
MVNLIPAVHKGKDRSHREQLPFTTAAAQKNGNRANLPGFFMLEFSLLSSQPSLNLAA